MLKFFSLDIHCLTSRRFGDEEFQPKMILPEPNGPKFESFILFEFSTKIPQIRQINN